MNNFCNQCGKPVPPGSKFCNHCGAKLPQVEALREEEVQSEPLPQPDDNDRFDDDFEQETDSGGSSFGRKLLAAIITILIIAVVGIYLYRNHIDTLVDISQSQVDAPAQVVLTPNEAMSVFRQTLHHDAENNGAIMPELATQVASRADTILRVVGVAQSVDARGAAMRHIYVLERNQAQGWDIVKHDQASADHSILQFAPRDIIKDNFNGDYPRQVEIDGKHYLFFAYLSKARVVTDSDHAAKVVMCLFNLDIYHVLTLDIEGSLSTFNDHEVVKALYAAHRDTPEANYMLDAAEELACVRMLTPEEVEMEKPENAAAKWRFDNQLTLSEVMASTPDVVMNVTLYSRPTFAMTDIVPDTRIENDNFVVVVVGDGTVYGYSKRHHGYFVVYSPANADAGARSASFDVNGNIVILIPQGKLIFNPATKVLRRA